MLNVMQKIIAIEFWPPTLSQNLSGHPQYSKVYVTQWNFKGADVLNSKMTRWHFIIKWFIMYQMSLEMTSNV